MTPPDHPVPGARLATDDAGAAQIDQILARRRSELARLGLTARSAVRRRDAAEARLVEHQAGYAGDATPSDLLSVVESMIERAVRSCDETLAAARREADEKVAQAVAESLAELRRVGLDASHVPATRRPWPGHHVLPPPSAGELWRRVGGVRESRAPGSSATEGQIEGVAAEGRAPHLSEEVSTGPHDDTAVIVPASSLPSPDGYAELRPTAVATLVVDEAELDGPIDDQRSAAFDTFWQEADRDRRSRGRFLRRSTKEDS